MSEQTSTSDQPPPESDTDLFEAIINAASPERLSILASQAGRENRAQTVAQNLAVIVHPRSQRSLLGRLRGGGRYSVSQRRNAIAMIRLLRQPVDVEPFIAAIWDRNALIRLEATEALGEIGLWLDWASSQMARIVHALTIALRHRYAEIRQAAALAVARISAWEATDALFQRLEVEKDPAVRETVALALGVLSSAEAVFPLLDSFENEEIEREVCLDALARLDQGAVEPLISVLRRWNVRAVSRAIAAEALGLFGQELAFEHLMIVLERPHEPEDVRIAAARALGQLGDSAAILPLWRIRQEPGIGLALAQALDEALARLQAEK